MVCIPLAILGGGAISPGILAGDSGRMLVIFLGLVSASILPTISLLVNSMVSTGKSVQAVNDLKGELDSAMDALFLLFGCVGIVVGALIAISIPAPQLLHKIPYLTSQILPRSAQVIIVTVSTLTILRIGQIPAILRRAMALRHKIATDEARKRTLENAPPPGAAKDAFTTHPDFGKSVRLEDLNAGNTYR